MKLLDSQQAAIDRLARLKVGANFAEPGTGKTRSTIELIKSSPCDLVVWFTPFQTKENLSAEIERWGSVGREVKVVGTESISSSDRLYLELLRLIGSRSTFLVIDESLKIKNWDAIRTQRLLELSKLCEYRLILNGTPVSRNLLDMWAQMEFLSPKILNMSQAEYKNTFCEYTKITRRIGNRHYTKEFVTKHHNVDYLYSIISPYVYECDLKLEAGKQYFDVEYRIDQEAQKAYDEIKKKFLDQETLLIMNNNIFLAMTQKMQHGYCCSEEKFQAVEKILSSHDRSKVAIFRKFVDSEVALKQRFPDVAIFSIQSHAFGLNLQDYNVIIGWDRVWDYALMDQRDRRIWRTGQEETCYYYELTGNVKLEEMMAANVEKKGKVLKYFKEHGYQKVIEQL